MITDAIITPGKLEGNTSDWNDLADSYNIRKRTSLESILYCGKLLCDAKEKLGHGMFLKWLEDPRVSESERTAQRLMAVYREFFHILDKPDKISLLARMGISTLMEMKKLPERYRKDIEVVTVDKNGEEQHKMVSVVDEDKVVGFLEQTVQFEGEQVKVSELPTKEFRKMVEEQQGIYAPTPEESMGVDEPIEYKPIQPGEFTRDESETSQRMTELDVGISILNSKLSELMKIIDEVNDPLKLFELPEDFKTKVKKELMKSKSLMEGMIVKSNELVDKL